MGIVIFSIADMFQIHSIELKTIRYIHGNKVGTWQRLIPFLVVLEPASVYMLIQLVLNEFVKILQACSIIACMLFAWRGHLSFRENGENHDNKMQVGGTLVQQIERKTNFPIHIFATWIHVQQYANTPYLPVQSCQTNSDKNLKGPNASSQRLNSYIPDGDAESKNKNLATTPPGFPILEGHDSFRIVLLYKWFQICGVQFVLNRSVKMSQASSVCKCKPIA